MYHACAMPGEHSLGSNNREQGGPGNDRARTGMIEAWCTRCVAVRALPPAGIVRGCSGGQPGPKDIGGGLLPSLPASGKVPMREAAQYRCGCGRVVAHLFGR